MAQHLAMYIIGCMVIFTGMTAWWAFGDRPRPDPPNCYGSAAAAAWPAAPHPVPRASPPAPPDTGIGPWIHGACDLRYFPWIHSVSAFKEFTLKHSPRTDKVTTHEYQLFYHKYLKELVLRKCRQRDDFTVRVLEIGLGCGMPAGPGGSALLFRKLLGVSPIQLQLHYIEYGRTCGEKWQKEHPGVLDGLHIGDQSDVSTLNRVYEDAGGLPFDFIIDDGSHLNEHMRISLTTLFQYVAPGGHYAIEDMHASCKSWQANIANIRTKGVVTGGTAGCMKMANGQPTMLSTVFDWGIQMMKKRAPQGIGQVASIEMFPESVVFSKRADEAQLQAKQTLESAIVPHGEAQ